jgi:hypothetical protein
MSPLGAVADGGPEAGDADPAQAVATIAKPTLIATSRRRRRDRKDMTLTVNRGVAGVLRAG